MVGLFKISPLSIDFGVIKDEMSKIYAPVNPNRQREHPPPVQNWLSENDPIYFILDTVTKLDISTITAKYEQEKQGFPPYSPSMMIALLLYSYFCGILSSRKIMQACQKRLTFRAIVGDNIPNWRIISDFRKLNIKELEGLFVQVLKLCQRADLVKLDHISSDSTKGKASASRHKTMSYGRMKQGDKHLKEEIRQLLSEAEAVDQQEEQGYVTNGRDRKLPKHLVHQQNRLELTWRANGALETADGDFIKQTKAESKSDNRHSRGRKRTVILDIPDESEDRLPTWEEAAQKCIEVYWEVISKHKNCPRRQ